MKKFRKVFALALAVAVSLTVFTGCGGNDAKKESKTGTSTTGNSSNGKQIIKIGLSGDFPTFDPQENNNVSMGYITRHIYSNLIKITPENKFVGDLAKEWEYKDDKTVAFTLNEGVKFHNGDTLTSEDVKFSLERQKKSAKTSHLVTMIDNVEVVDPTHFVIHMNAPTNALLSSLQHMCTAILPKKYTEELEASGKHLTDAPIGSGPYKFVEWLPGASAKIEKFDDYFDKANMAQNDGIEFKIIPEEASRTIALENGEIDLLMNVSTNDAKRIRENSKLALDEYTSTAIEWFAGNETKAPFDNKLVRQALNHAINKQDVIMAAINGEGKPIDSYIGEAAIGYYDVYTKYDYNPEKAKALLAEAGYPNGFSFTCFVFGDERARAATVIQSNLAALGITMQIEQMDKAVFYETTGNGEHEACMTGWIANAEPDNTYRPLYTSEKAGPGGNRTFYRNSKVDDLINEAAVSTDKARIEECYKEVNKIMSEDAVYVPLYSPIGMIARNSELKGMQLSSIGYEVFSGLHY